MEQRKSSFDDHLRVIESGHSKTASDKNQQAVGGNLLMKLAQELGMEDAAQTAAAAKPATDVAGVAGSAAPSAEGEVLPSAASVAEANAAVVAAIDAVVAPQMAVAGGDPAAQAAGMVAAASQPVAAQPAISAADGVVTDSNAFSKDPAAVAAAAQNGGGDEGAVSPEVAKEAAYIGKLIAQSFQAEMDKQAADQEYTQSLEILKEAGLLDGYNIQDKGIAKTASATDGYLEKVAAKQPLQREDVIGAAYELIDLQKQAELAEEQGRQEAQALAAFLTKVAEEEGKETTEEEDEEGKEGEDEKAEDEKVAAYMKDPQVVNAVRLLRSKGIV